MSCESTQYPSSLAQAAGEPPDTTSDHLAIDRVDRLDSRFGFDGRVVVVGEVTVPASATRFKIRKWWVGRFTSVPWSG